MRIRPAYLPAAAATVAAVLTMGKPGGLRAVAATVGAYVLTAILLALVATIREQRRSRVRSLTCPYCVHPRVKGAARP
jgi:xanthine/uracil permease